MRCAVPRATRHAPSRLVPTTAAQSSSVTSSVEAGRAIPELFTRMSGVPSTSRTVSSAWPTLCASGDVHSHRMRDAAGFPDFACGGFEPPGASWPRAPPMHRARRGCRRKWRPRPLDAAGHERSTAAQVEGRSFAASQILLAQASRYAPLMAMYRRRSIWPERSVFLRGGPELPSRAAAGCWAGHGVVMAERHGVRARAAGHGLQLRLVAAELAERGACPDTTTIPPLMASGAADPARASRGQVAGDVPPCSLAGTVTWMSTIGIEDDRGRPW